LVVTFIVGYARVNAGVHSVAQVLVGAAVGLAFGVTWFNFGHVFVSRFFPAISELSISKYLYIRDSTEVHNILEVEYEAARLAAQRAKQSHLKSL
jgi:hypothetical protein